jgi:chromosome segregation ATPase
MEINRLEKVRAEQADRIDEGETTIRQDAADLEDFRGRLSRSESELKRSQAALASAAVERDQLKAVVEKWEKAVSERDAALTLAGEQVQKLGAQRNKVVGQFNELANKYNAIVKQMDEERAKQ